MTQLIVLAVMFALMWVLFILPQQRRVKAHQALVSSLMLGDEVMTTAGIYGRITGLDDELVRVEVSPGVELRLAKGAVAKRVVDQPAPAEPGDDEPPGPLAS